MNLIYRIATAFALIPVLVLAINWKDPYGVYGLVSVATMIALREYFLMCLEDPIDRVFGIVLGLVLSQLMYWWVPGGYLLALPAAVLIPALYYLYRFRDLETVIGRLGLTVVGLLYAAVLFTFVPLLKRDGGDHGADWVYLVLMTAWFGDTGAYFAGRFLGKKKLYPAISPGKTWAGAIGGLAGSFGAAALANVWFFPELGWGHGAVLTIVGGALGQSGDLVESMLKRARKVKDSGTLLPGHGGMLDRVDAVLFIAPWMYLYAMLAWR
jgi:phosphatidate cytidylyltransferase